MPKYISTKQLADGYQGFPPIDETAQNNLRQKKKITYQKIAGKVYYTEDNLKDNLCEVLGTTN